MTISKDLESRGSKKPILLKGTGQSLCLEVKIGQLGLELWHFPNEEAQPYARLIFGLDQDPKADGLIYEERTEWPVILDWQQACAVSGAIQEWVSFLESSIKDYHELTLHMELASLTFDFYQQGEGQGPRMACSVNIDGGLSRQVVLTCLEAAFLGRLLFCLGDDEAAGQQG